MAKQLQISYHTALLITTQTMWLLYQQMSTRAPNCSNTACPTHP